MIPSDPLCSVDRRSDSTAPERYRTHFRVFMRTLRTRVRRVLIAGVLGVTLTGFIALDDELAAVAESLELFGHLYRELTVNYVDRLDAMQLTKAAVKGMLSTLDPYTVFVEAEQKADLDMLTTGSYGGIGITVTNRRGRHVITGMLDSVASTAYGLRLGDEIIRIDTVDVRGVDRELRTLLRGPSSSSVTLTLTRPSVPGSFTRVIMRREVPVRSVSLVEQFPDGIAYIKLDRFTRSAGSDVRNALRDLSGDGPPRGVILDLRDNPGGLLESAVEVMESLLPRGSLVVSTRGRQPHFTREYRSDDSPVNDSIPLVLLVNQASASASEIVAGAVQDLDRGVVLGIPTFGKGLVQSVFPIRQNASLKLTTSKYYTPSGRCIQKMNYATAGSSAIRPSEADDSSRIYRSARLGRPLRGSGGVQPDITVRADTSSVYLDDLRREFILFDFVTVVLNRARPDVLPVVDGTMKRAFRAHLDSLSFQPDAELGKAYDALKRAAQRRSFDLRFERRLKQLHREISAARAAALDSHWPEVQAALEEEFAFHRAGRPERLRTVMRRDVVIRTAREILQTPRAYQLAFGGTSTGGEVPEALPGQ